MFAAPPISYQQPKLISRAPSNVEPAGAGHVLVQVQVNADGTFKVVRVIRSSNAGDNAAALNIAAHSSYAPARRNGRPVRGIFDFEVVFGQKAVSGSAAQIAVLLHQNNFAGAKSAATKALAQNPNDALIRAQLGVADAFMHDVSGAAAEFDQAGKIPALYQNVAMQVYSLNAVAITGTHPKTALAQAQKAVSLDGDYNAYYALGEAEHANGQDAAAMQTLAKAQSLAQSTTPPADAADQANIDVAMLSIAQAQGDAAEVARATAAIDRLDPTLAPKVSAYAYDLQATALEKKGDYGGAVSLFEKAAAADPAWAGAKEYTKAAIALTSLPIPNYQGARFDAQKALQIDPNYALGYFVAAVAMGSDALVSGSGSELQDSDIYANKAAALAQKQGNAKLATSAAYYAKNHQLDANLQFWSTGISINSMPGGPAR